MESELLMSFTRPHPHKTTVLLCFDVTFVLIPLHKTNIFHIHCLFYYPFMFYFTIQFFFFHSVQTLTKSLL